MTGISYNYRNQGKPIIAAVVMTSRGSFTIPYIQKSSNIKLLRGTCGRMRHGLVEVIFDQDKLVWPDEYVFHAETGEPLSV